MSNKTIKLLGFNGSLRKDSYSKAILLTLAEKIPDKATMDTFSLADIPLYNEDINESELPDSVQRFKDAIAASDGLLICTPEYNYGISGVLKNALDWASRPAYESVLKDKPAFIISSSPAITGGVRALDQVRQTLYATLARVVPAPEIVIGNAHQKISDGRLTDETSLKFAMKGLDTLIAEVQMLKAGK